MSNFDWAGFLIFVLVFCHLILNLAEMSVVKSRLSVYHGANLFKFEICRAMKLLF